jgi:hypothetical protein
LKKEIIIKNLYGVDIQEGAIEIAKLRLWLSMVSEMELKAEDIEPLPNIDYNLLTGNSLIGYIKLPERWGSTLFDDPQKIKKLLEERQKLINIYRETRSSIETEKLEKDIEKINKKIREELDQMLLNEFKANNIKISKEEFKNLKPFHWGFEFYDAFNEEKSNERGFNVIIGNPPYYSIDPKLKRISKSEHLFFRKTYQTFHGQTDIFVFFYERSISLIKKNGILGFISKNRWQDSPSYKAFCDFLSDKNIKILDFDDTFIFVGVGVTTNIIFINKSKNPQIEYWLYDNSGLEKIFYPNHYEKNVFVFNKGQKLELLSNEITNYIDRIGEKIFIGGCGHKITPSEFFIIKKINNTEFEPENLQIKNKTDKIKLTNQELEYVFKFTSSGNIFPYYINNNRYIFYLRNVSIEKLPNIKDYFEKIKPKKSCKKWYEFHCGHGYRNVDLIESKEKIIFPNRMYLNRKCSFYLDLNKILIGMDCGAAILNRKDIDNKTILPILNSNLIWYYIRRKFKRYANRQTTSIEKIPIKIPKNKQLFKYLCTYMIFLNQIEERRRCEKKIIEFIQNLIDSLVYELYFKEKLKTDILNLIEKYLKDITDLESDDEKIKTIKQIYYKIKSDFKIMKLIDEIHNWFEIVEKRNKF